MLRGCTPSLVAATWAATAVLLAGCVFDLPPLGGAGAGAGSGGTAGTAGTGGTVGGGGAGTGGDDPPCDPPAAPAACTPGIDVSPRLVMSIGDGNISSGDRPHIAWSESVFGVYTRMDQHTGPGRNVFWTLARNGTPQSSEVGPFEHSINAAGWLGSASGHFAVATRPDYDQPLAVVRFDRCGQQLGSILAAGSISGQEAAFGGAGAHFLITGQNADGVQFAVVPDAAGSVSLASSGVDATCCGMRTYAAGEALGRFYVAGGEYTTMQLTAIEPTGSIAYTAPLTGVEGDARFIGAHGASLVLVTETHVALIDPAGPTLQSLNASENAYRCAFAANGSQVRRACLNDQSSPAHISFDELDPATGLATSLHELRVADAESAPSIAWDGYGWGVTWYEQNAVAYAHVCEP